MPSTTKAPSPTRPRSLLTECIRTLESNRADSLQTTGRPTTKVQFAPLPNGAARCTQPPLSHATSAPIPIPGAIKWYDNLNLKNPGRDVPYDWVHGEARIQYLTENQVQYFRRGAYGWWEPWQIVFVDERAKKMGSICMDTGPGGWGVRWGTWGKMVDLREEMVERKRPGFKSDSVSSVGSSEDDDLDGDEDDGEGNADEQPSRDKEDGEDENDHEDDNDHGEKDTNATPSENPKHSHSEVKTNDRMTHSRQHLAQLYAQNYGTAGSSYASDEEACETPSPLPPSPSRRTSTSPSKTDSSYFKPHADDTSATSYGSDSVPSSRSSTTSSAGTSSDIGRLYCHFPDSTTSSSYTTSSAPTTSHSSLERPRARCSTPDSMETSSDCGRLYCDNTDSTISSSYASSSDTAYSTRCSIPHTAATTFDDGRLYCDDTDSSDADSYDSDSDARHCEDDGTDARTDDWGHPDTKGRFHTRGFYYKGVVDRIKSSEGHESGEEIVR